MGDQTRDRKCDHCGHPAIVIDSLGSKCADCWLRKAEKNDSRNYQSKRREARNEFCK